MANPQHATFAAGCFWGVEDILMKIPGITNSEVGYTNGQTENPTYEDVCGKGTGHAEAVKLTFDPDVVSYDALLEAFWGLHDPTQMNRQGPDVGSQYRSGIYTHSEEQRVQAEASKKALDESGTHKDPVVTEIEDAGPWWKAEKYHQEYFQKNGGANCHI